MTYTYTDASGTVHTRVITVPGAVSLLKQELSRPPRVELTGNYTRHTLGAQVTSAREVYKATGGRPLVTL